MEFIWIVIGIIYVAYKLITESTWYVRRGYVELTPEEKASMSRQSDLQYMTESKLGELLGVPFSELPAADNPNHRRMCVQALILKKEGHLMFKYILNRSGGRTGFPIMVLESEYGKKLVEFVEDYKAKHPPEVVYKELSPEQKASMKRQRELGSMLASQLEEVLGIHPYKIPFNCDYLIQDKIVEAIILKREGLLMCEFRHKEDGGYVEVPITILNEGEGKEIEEFVNNFWREYPDGFIDGEPTPEQKATIKRQSELAQMSNEELGDILGVPARLIPYTGVKWDVGRISMEALVLKKEGHLMYKYFPKENGGYTGYPILVLNNEGKEIEQLVNDYLSEHQQKGELCEKQEDIT